MSRQVGATIRAMGFHPANLAFRFALELVSLVGLFRLGLESGDGVLGWVLGLAFTITGMALWATFRVPGDRSASGEAPFSTTGRNRLLIEVVVLGAGALGWFLAGPSWFAWANLVSLVVHSALSYDRIGWLLDQT